MYFGNARAITKKKNCKRSIILMVKKELKWNHAQLKPEKSGKDMGKKKRTEKCYKHGLYGSCYVH